MRILHLSDLHLTAPFRTLEDVWHGPGGVLRPGSFDFVIVSGDLSQRAHPDEYAALGSFAENHLLRYLRRPGERQRVVFVPGNHDVDWSADIGAPQLISRFLEANREDVLARRLRELSHRPDASDLRQVVSKYGHLELVELDPKRYPARFKNVQAFLARFYGDALAAGAHRAFDLASEDDARHWSAHVFPEERVAFYGFSSCHNNDRYWHGANISTRAVLRAQAHAEEHAAGMLRVAVWHHGLVSERGRPDHLTLQDVGLLYNAGFRIGFHGHTHEAAHEILDRFFGDRFVVVSTGSLGAGSAERPDAVGNQFSVVRLYPGQVDVQVFERAGATGTYPPDPPRRLYLLPPERMDAGRPTTAALHRRLWTVRPDGIADVTVTLEDLRLNGAVTLALVAPPYGGVAGDAAARTPVGNLPVARADLGDRRVRFTLEGDGAGVTARECVWRYHVSNAVALHAAELRLAIGREGGHDNLDPATEEALSHAVQFPCDRLALALAFEGNAPGVAPGTARAVVERRAQARGQEPWRRVEREEERCVVTADPAGRRAELAIEAPVVGYRYSLVYRPAATEPPRPAEALRVARAVAERCLDEVDAGDGSLVAALTAALQEQVHLTLGSALGPGAMWMGLLWHDQQRQLVPAFGRFPRQCWNERYPSGMGVSGHVFRFRHTATWHDDRDARGSLICLPDLELRPFGGRRPRWIVCMPIVTADDAPVGVVRLWGYASHGQATDAEHTLLALAEDGARGPLSEEHLASVLTFRTMVDASFWNLLAAWTPLPQFVRRFAKDTVEERWPG